MNGSFVASDQIVFLSDSDEDNGNDPGENEITIQPRNEIGSINNQSNNSATNNSRINDAEVAHTYSVIDDLFNGPFHSNASSIPDSELNSPTAGSELESVASNSRLNQLNSRVEPTAKRQRLDSLYTDNSVSNSFHRSQLHSENSTPNPPNGPNLVQIPQIQNFRSHPVLHENLQLLQSLQNPSSHSVVTVDSDPDNVVYAPPTRPHFDMLQDYVESEGNFSFSAPKEVEVIDLSSDEDPLPEPQHHTSNTSNTHTNGTANAIDRTSTITNGNNTIQDDDSDDDLMIIDEQEAVRSRSFKPTSFERNRHRDPLEEEIERNIAIVPGYNRPAPVPHLSDSDFSMNQLAIRELQNKESRLTQEINKSYANLSSCETQRTTYSAMYSEGLKRVQDLKNQLGLAITQGAQNLVGQMRDLLERKELEVRNVKVGLGIRDNLVIANSRKLQELTRSLRSIRQELKRQGAANGFQDTVQVYNDGQSFQEHPAIPSGYQANIYSDSKDLQNLLDNIKPDEDLEEGIEPTPKELSINLMKHQRLGLTWLLRMENSKAKGGILADDMGLGKTVQTLALLMANKSKDPTRKTTLIIAPVSLLRQWDAEIESKVKADIQVKVAIYHGNDKKQLSTFKDLAQYDVIMTSYGTLSSEWKKHFSEVITGVNKKKSNYLPHHGEGGRSYVSPFFSKEAFFYRIILDEAQNIKNKLSLASRAVTLLRADYRFCLSGTPMQNNVEELYPIIRFLQIRPYNEEQRFRVDIAIPLKSKNREYDDYDKTQSMKKLRAILKAILLRRSKTTLIDGKPILSLPEKHLISDFVELDTEEQEFYNSLESGIKKKAKKIMSQQKRMGMASGILTLLLRLRQACCHNYLVEIGEIKAKDRKSDSGKKRIIDWRFMLRQLATLDASVISRIKHLDHAYSGGVSKKIIKNDSNEIGGPKIESNDFLESLVEDSDNEDNSNDSPDNDEDNMFTCPICYSVVNNLEDTLIFPNCGHMICSSCEEVFFEDQLEDDSGESNVARCKECGTKVKQSTLIDYMIFKLVHHDQMELPEIASFCTRYYAISKTPTNMQLVQQLVKRDNGLTPSAKISKCVELLREIFKSYPGEKIIVFSQFTSLFDIMKLVLDKEEIDFLRYDGSMTIDHKNSTIKRFYQEDVKVLLLSLKAGNVGLTLTCASHVIIIDPFWNPYVEEQAMDRAHRIGQEREVFVHRILIAGTVESRIMELQDRKREMVGAALDEKGMKSVSRLGQKELGFLFGLNSLT
ncbi:hypothetical protein G9P44_004052 [Scheffersomyces stipitis]|nr:hypothetical protein G9P44_004052 [Scheffersomyces stipitis]